MIHAITLLCVLLFAAPLFSYVPMAALAGILMVVAYNMGEWREIPQLSSKNSDFAPRGGLSRN